jgi:conjugative relaxase-like TrwC/TraI family protein
MLRVRPNSSVDQAKSYFATPDYYLGDGEQELKGQWRGKGARMLGLSGEVKQADWHALSDNLNPQTGERLTIRQKSNRTVGYDWNFHVPKSVSLLYAETLDERILDAFRGSVDETMRDAEADMATRVRKAGKDENRTTGNMVWGEHIHLTSRPVGGVPDPHLHAHCFVFNATFDQEEQAWKAGQFRELKRDSPYYEALFHSRLSHRLAQLGLPIERTKKGWELAGIGRPLVEKFSRRKAQVDAKARELGIVDAEEKSELVVKTRERKRKELKLPELQELWRDRMTREERKALAALADKLGGDASPRSGNAAARAMEYATSHAFERRSVMPERDLLAIALKQAVGQATVEQVRDQAARSELIIGDRDGRRMATTHEVLKEEHRLIEFAKAGRGRCRPFVGKDGKFKRDWLSDEQKKAVAHITGSRDRIIVLRGSAGVGKTTLLQETVEAIEESGKKVFAFAPSSDASRGTLRDAGFKDADTVARLLVDEKLQQQIAGQLILVDEAGLLGMKTMSQVFSLAEKLECRVLLSGDRRQHGSVERGAALRLLEEQAGIVPAQVKEIKRQSGEYKAAIKALSEGRVAEGFKRLDDLKWVREISDGERDQHLAADYLQAVSDKKTAIVVSPTHAEGDRITVAIRDALRKKGKLKADERTFRVLENANLTEAERTDSVNYLPGDVLVFHQNGKGGFTRGQKVTVENGKPLPFDQAARFQMFHATTLAIAPGDMVRITRNGQTADRKKHRLDNGTLFRVKGFDKKGNIVLANGWTIDKDFGHLAHGYVVTSHAAQGKSVQRVFVGQSSQSFPASSREQFYVSASRGEEQVIVYTDDKKALLEAVSQSDERLSATDLVNGDRRGRTITPARNYPTQDKKREQERDGAGYDR